MAKMQKDFPNPQSDGMFKSDKSIKKSYYEFEFARDLDEYGEVQGWDSVYLPDSIQYNGRTYNAVDNDDGYLYYIDEEDGVSLWVSTVQDAPFPQPDITVNATHPNGSQINSYSSTFVYYEGVSFDEQDKVPQMIMDAVAQLSEQSKSAKKSRNVKKEQRGDKCVNYLNLPVCPECGSPNLHETDTDGEITNCWCDRCGTKCWFDSSFDTETGADRVRFRIGESAKKMRKSKPQTFSEMVAKQRAKNNPVRKDRM